MKSQPAKRSQKNEKRGKQSRSKSTARKWDEMNRAQRREMMRKMQSEDFDLEVVHPHAAGIDIGNESHYVGYRRAATRNRCDALAARPLS